MSAQQTDEQKNEPSKSVPETPEGAAAMLQSALRQCQAAGLKVQALNHPQHGLVIAVPALMGVGTRITVRPVAPVTAPAAAEVAA